MADSKERRKTPRKPAPATPRPDSLPASVPTSSGVRTQGSGEDTRRRIAEAAYFRAKERGFAPGHELEDWVEAESEVMGRINGSDREPQ
jgi:Protein of unknown function (DUF2934)